LLEDDRHVVEVASDGRTAIELAEATAGIETVILDVGLPDISGLDVARRLRKDGRDLAILMLTARDTVTDRVTGLDAGADDYLVKPFEIQELEARVRACLRRHRGLVTPELLTVADLSLDTGTLTVRRGGKEISVTPIGMKILSVLMRAAPRVVSRRDIERQVWGDVLPDSDALRSHLYNLRKAVDRPFEHALIHTVQSAGYRMAPPDGG
jgi:DNA-binding response OmpR family regulator